MADGTIVPTRRHAMTLAGGLAGAVVLSAEADAAPAAPPGPPLELTPTAVDGPYYADLLADRKLTRVDIAEDKPGIPMECRVQIVTADGKPLAGVRVDIWHADTEGNYSGFDEHGDSKNPTVAGQTFFRGIQTTSDDGRVVFRTIYPGWYQSRTPHVHLKTFLGRRCILTAQMYFPDIMSEYIYTSVPMYIRRDNRDTLNVADKHKIRAGDTTDARVVETKDRYVAELRLVVDPGADYALAMPPPDHRPPYAATKPYLVAEQRVDALIPGLKPKAL